VGEFSFTRKDRLLDASAYSRVFDGASAKASHKYSLLLAISNDLDHHRLGLIVAKKNVRLAAQRNRIKRITRETFRQCGDSGHGIDVIVMARRGADQLDNQTLTTILRQQWQKLRSK